MALNTRQLARRNRFTKEVPLEFFQKLIVFLLVVSTSGVDAGSINLDEDAVAATPTVDWNAAAQQTLQSILASERNENVARNVILFLGDGMGVSTVTGGRIYSGQLQGQTGEEYDLTFDKFPYVALAKTYGVDCQVSDSGNSDTAIMSGIKTNLGVIGVNENVRRGVCSDMPGNSVDSIVQWSIREGKRTGIVTTTRVTHATPASGYAHTPERNWEWDGMVPPESRSDCPDIATQLVTDNTNINVVLGGGRAYFLPADGIAPNKGIRLDGRDLIEEWKNAQQDQSAIYVSSKADFDAVEANTTDYLFGMFNDDHMQYRTQQQDGGTPEPTLAEMTDKAIQVLQRDECSGFFLLVEGGRIDTANHLTQAKLAFEEMVGFDEAIQRALDLVDLSDTLIVVTGDHSSVIALGGYPTRGNPILGLVDPHGFEAEPSIDNLPYLSVMYTNGPGIPTRTDLTDVDTESNTFKQPVAVPLHNETHGGEDCPVYATGPWSHIFRGVLEQNYIAHGMAFASCVGPGKRLCQPPYNDDES